MGDYISWDSVLFLLTVDLIICCGYSVFLGLLVAKAAQGSLVVGGLVGLAVVVGPVIWMVRAIGRDRSLIRVTRRHSRDALVYVAAAGFLLAAVMLVVGMFLPWVRAEGAVGNRSLVLEGSSADTFVGVLAVGLTVVLLVVAAAAGLVWSCSGRAAAVAGLAGALWLVVVADLWIVADALSQVSSMAEDASAGQASASFDLGSAVWVTLVAVAVTFGGAVALTLSAEEAAPALVIPAKGVGLPGWTGSSSEPRTSATDYGDGF